MKDYYSLKKLEWPSETYATRHVDGTVTDAELTTDLLVWKETPKTSQQTKELHRRYKDLRGIKGRNAMVYLNTRTEDFDGEKTERDQVLLKLCTDGTESDCFRKLCEARDYMVKQERKCIALYPPKGNHLGPSYRKMVECIFGQSNIECTIYFQDLDKKSKMLTKRNGTYAVIVRREQGGTYADLLKKVKDTIGKENGMNQ